MEPTMPQIKSFKGYPTLFVDGEPFVILGGEVHNSSASHGGYMDETVWPNLRGLGMNTVVAPVYWECLEPEEGAFDFSLVDSLLMQARREGMKLVLLWFGLWKNAESMYVPGWMKRDKDTYYMSRRYNGEPLKAISPFCQAAVEKDKNAFCRLMAHLKEKDSREHTVIMIQVENEIGLLGSERDYCQAAEELFAGQEPEAFMAWGFARAVEEIASAGKAVYPLPMYVNAWLEQFPWRAGTYPSGGPVMKMADVWKKTAPSIFTQAPDIYVPYVPQVLEEYSRADNPLFVPEVRKDAVTAAYALYAVFGCNAIGFSPFGIEELRMDPDSIDKPPMEVMIALNIDPSAFEIQGSAEYLAAVYDMINRLLPCYYQYRGSAAMQAYIRKDVHELGTVLSFQNYDVQINYSRKGQCQPEPAGVVFQLGADEFLIAGMMSSVQILPKLGSNEQVEKVRLEEGTMENGVWKKKRILNGDEQMMLTLKDMPVMYRMEVCRYR